MKKKTESFFFFLNEERKICAVIYNLVSILISVGFECVQTLQTQHCASRVLKKKKNERKSLASDCGDEGKNEDDDHTHTKSCFFGTHHNEAHSNCGLRVSMCFWVFFVFDILHITVIVAGCDVRRISRCVELIIYGIGFIPLVIRVTVCRRGRIHCQWPAG